MHKKSAGESWSARGVRWVCDPGQWTPRDRRWPVKTKDSETWAMSADAQRKRCRRCAGYVIRDSGHYETDDGGHASTKSMDSSTVRTRRLNLELYSVYLRPYTLTTTPPMSNIPPPTIGTERLQTGNRYTEKSLNEPTRSSVSTGGQRASPLKSKWRRVSNRTCSRQGAASRIGRSRHGNAFPIAPVADREMRLESEEVDMEWIFQSQPKPTWRRVSSHTESRHGKEFFREFRRRSTVFD
ncbi:hypothetical protein K440DRAFT_18083 [Wilcoxina mikolae CBS 423.85]|nr:hypothetical protein K440DRAFT_18083 [Wilcoxina mikolae CBS 423.85]